MAVVAEEEEGRAISERIKAALAAARARTKLGKPNGAAALRRAAKGIQGALQAVRGGAADGRAKALAGAVAEARAAGAVLLAKSPWHSTSGRYKRHVVSGGTLQVSGVSFFG